MHHQALMLPTAGESLSGPNNQRCYTPRDYHLDPWPWSIEDYMQALQGLKILHAPIEIAGNMARICRRLRARGLEATDANYYDSWLGYSNTISLHLNAMAQPQAKAAMREFARRAVEEYDIFHFHWAKSLLEDYSDLPEIAQRGKKIVFSFWGSDCASLEWIFYNQARFLGYDPPRPYFLSRTHVRVHQVIDHYAEAIVGLLRVPRWIYFPGAIDLDQWDIALKHQLFASLGFHKDPSKVYFVHAPTKTEKKGSSLIIKLFQEAARDLPIELIVVQGRKPQEAKRIFSLADFAIDQVGGGTFGAFGLEMMAWGVPVLVHHDELLWRLRGGPPVIPITKANFREQLQRCVEIKMSGELEELGAKCRQWVEQWAAIEAWVDDYIIMYGKIVMGEPIAHVIDMDWRRQQQGIVRGHKSEFYRFMKRYNVFEQLGISPPDYDRALYY